MTDMPSSDATPLDRAVAAAQAAGEAPETSGRVADALLAAPLWLLLEETPEGDRIRPTLLELEAGPTALAFDAEDRLTAFAEGPAAAAQMPGRALVSMFAGAGLNLAVNPGVAPSEMFWDAAAVAWAAEALTGAVETEAAKPEALAAPEGLLPGALELIGAKLAALAPSLAEAILTEARFADGSARLLLVLRLNGAEAADPDLAAGVEAGVARALADTGRLAGAQLPELDAVFPAEDAPLLDRARRVGLAVELPAPPPAPEKPARPAPKAPGSDPDAPPILR